MDFGIRNPVIGHSSHIDEKAQAWGGVDADILTYLSDVSKLEQFADMAQNTAQLAEYLDPFLDNAKTYFEAMQKLADGQVTWTELRKQFGDKVANAIAKIRKMNAEFDAQMQRIDAQDRADLLRIEQKRKNALTEIASQLHQDLEAELWRHQNKMATIDNKQEVAAQRQEIQNSLREKRQQLLARVRYGSKALNPNQEPSSQIPVQVADRPQNPSSSVSASGNVRGFGNWWTNFLDGLGNR
ncbi:MAG: hypothetical protein FWK04_29625 [Nostoc sp. GBBB01]|nr:hypothetical protein [Nostoc sp. GBBB01]